MRQTTIYEFLDDLADEVTNFKQSQSEADEFNDAMDKLNVEEPTFTEPPLIETCINTFIEHCTTESRIPTLEEAQSIYILDSILSKYNA